MVAHNAGASLVDLGDGVLTVELHSKMNTIGADTIEMLGSGVAEAEKNFDALVVGSEATNFSAGANLLLVLLKAAGGELGRYRPDGAPVSGGSSRFTIRGRSRDCGTGRPDTGRRLRDYTSC